MNQQDFFQEQDYTNINQVDEYIINSYVAKVFGWMFLGLLITALTMGGIVYGINTSYAFLNFIEAVMNSIFIIVIAQFILVMVLSARVQTMNPATAKIMYIVYAMSMGLTIGLLIAWYVEFLGIYTVAAAFGITAISFGIMAIYGLTTKKDLTRFSSLFTMALFGIIIASIVNIFMGNAMLDLLIIVGGLFIFLIITAVRTYTIKNHFAHVALRGDNPDGTLSVEQERLSSNLSIIGALMLYLAFINMLLFMLRLMSRRR